MPKNLTQSMINNRSSSQCHSIHVHMLQKPRYPYPPQKLMPGRHNWCFRALCTAGKATQMPHQRAIHQIQPCCRLPLGREKIGLAHEGLFDQHPCLIPHLSLLPFSGGNANGVGEVRTTLLGWISPDDDTCSNSLFNVFRVWIYTVI